MSNSPFKNMDSLKLTFNHIKIWYTAGMGFFTDAYDLLVISFILATFNDAYKYYGMSMPGFTNYLIGPNSAFWTGLLGSSAIITAVLGELIFGFLGDKLGRKAVYGIEASLLTIGALLSAFAWNLPSLIFFRSILGLGIGGDYPISATIMSEYANVKDRGKLIALVFANQGIGSVAALAVGVISATIFPPDIAWRVMAGVGAIPAATVIYLRRKVPETPRYSLLVKGSTEEAKKAAKYLGTDIEANSNVRSGHKGVNEFLSTYWPVLIGTAGSWFLIDIALYGTGVYSSSALAPVFGSPFPSHATTLSLGEFQSDLAKALFLGGVPFLAGLPGYFTAVALLDKLGRKLIQLQGFIVLAIIYVVVASVMVVKGTKVEGFTIAPTLAFIIYSLSFYFIDFGANTTTFVIPAEVYPTKFRTTGHGISAASGKFGAAIATYLFPSLLAAIGIKEILIMLAILSVIGAILTYALIPEPKLKPLEEASREKIEVSQ